MPGLPLGTETPPRARHLLSSLNRFVKLPVPNKVTQSESREKIIAGNDVSKNLFLLIRCQGKKTESICGQFRWVTGFKARTAASWLLDCSQPLPCECAGDCASPWEAPGPAKGLHRQRSEQCYTGNGHLSKMLQVPVAHTRHQAEPLLRRHSCLISPIPCELSLGSLFCLQNQNFLKLGPDNKFEGLEGILVSLLLKYLWYFFWLAHGIDQHS